MKHVVIHLDCEMGYTTTWTVNAAAGDLKVTVRGRKPWVVCKRALKLLQRKVDHAERLH